MNKLQKLRNAKVQYHGHSSRINDLEKIIDTLVKWDEVTTVSVGRIKGHQASPSGDNKATMKVVDWTTTGGEDFVRTGILCQVRQGSSIQFLTLRGGDLVKLQDRLLATPAIDATNLLRNPL